MATLAPHHALVHDSPPAASRLALRLAAHRARRALRRGVDVAISGAALVVLAPLLAVVAIAIKLDSRGPIFFRQERLAQHGRRFGMWKLRTMVVDADRQKAALEAQGKNADAVRFKMKRDPRITRVGRVLRKLSIDELPQLANVLVGDMTLIGPRPPVLREVVLYDDRAMRRLEVPQGLTCLWQVKGRSDIPFEEQVELDIEYIDRATVRDELGILVATIPAVLTGRGAY